ncbi:MAG: hypothetical protein ACREGH_00675 [Minisyncoccia bacterium]
MNAKVNFIGVAVAGGLMLLFLAGSKHFSVDPKLLLPLLLMVILIGAPYFFRNNRTADPHIGNRFDGLQKGMKYGMIGAIFLVVLASVVALAWLGLH